MEDSKKKVVMVVVIVACLAAAGAITIMRSTGSGGLKDIPDSAMTWMRCRNQDCEATYQMGLKVFFKTVEEYHVEHPMTMTTPPLVCEKCGEESLYRAEKCPKCELVFERGSMGAQDFADRCPNPDCGFSPTEAKRLERAKNK